MTIEQTDSLYQGLLGIKWLIQLGLLHEAEVSLDKLLKRFDREDLRMFYNGDTQ